MRKIQSYLAMASGLAAMAESHNQVFFDNKPVPYQKSELNSKQVKARNKAKLAKRARKQRK